MFKRIDDSSDVFKLQSDLDAIDSWASTWQMAMNTSKCEACTICRKQVKASSNAAYQMKGTEIAAVTNFKYLGVTITSDLSFTTHIRNIVSKTNGLLYMLIRALKRSSEGTKTRAFLTICRPILEYASCIWSPSKVKDIKIVENVQRKAYRWATNTSRSEQISGAMVVKGWEELAHRRTRSDNKIIAKCTSGRMAVNINDYIDKNTAHDTRNGKIRRTFKTDIKKNFFFNRTL